MDEDYSHHQAFYIQYSEMLKKIPIHLFLKCQNVLQLLLNFTKESLIIHFSFIGGCKKKSPSLCKSAECENLGNVQPETFG